VVAAAISRHVLLGLPCATTYAGESEVNRGALDALTQPSGTVLFSGTTLVESLKFEPTIAPVSSREENHHLEYTS
jgi:hypothetical protein